MNKESIYKKSLDLAKEYVSSRDGHILNEEIWKYLNSGFEGPTIEEYLDILQLELQDSFEFETIYEYVTYRSGNILQYNLPNVILYGLGPQPQVMETQKKSSEVVSEFFFN